MSVIGHREPGHLVMGGAVPTLFGKMTADFRQWRLERQAIHRQRALIVRRLDLEDWKLDDMGFVRADLEDELRRLR